MSARLSSYRFVTVLLACATVMAVVPLRGHATLPSFAQPAAAKVNGYEPGVDVAPDGTIFVNAPGGGHSLLSRSTDGGKTFKQLNFGPIFSKFPGGGDSDVVVTTGPDGKNRVYFLDLWIVSDALAVSEDNGDTWTTGSPFTTLPASDRQWISLGNRDPLTAKDVVYAIYHLIQPPFTAMFSRSNDGGQTWPIQRALPTPLGGAPASPGNLISDGDYVGFIYDTGGDIRYAYSTDGGILEWNVSRINEWSGDAFGVIPSVAMDGNNLYATWIERGDYSTRVARSTDRGATWQELDYVNQRAVTVSAEGTSNVFPWIAARGGKVAVTWYSTPGDPESLDPNAQPNGQWKVFYAESFDGGINFTEPVPVSPDIVKSGPVCTAGLGCDLPPAGQGNRHLGDFMQIALDAQRRAVISYGAQSGGARIAVQNQ